MILAHKSWTHVAQTLRFAVDSKSSRHRLSWQLSVRCPWKMVRKEKKVSIKFCAIIFMIKSWRRNTTREEKCCNLDPINWQLLFTEWKSAFEFHFSLLWRFVSFKLCKPADMCRIVVLHFTMHKSDLVINLTISRTIMGAINYRREWNDIALCISLLCIWRQLRRTYQAICNRFNTPNSNEVPSDTHWCTVEEIFQVPRRTQQWFRWSIA